MSPTCRTTVTLSPFLQRQAKTGDTNSECLEKTMSSLTITNKIIDLLRNSVIAPIPSHPHHGIRFYPMLSASEGIPTHSADADAFFRSWSRSDCLGLLLFAVSMVLYNYLHACLMMNIKPNSLVDDGGRNSLGPWQMTLRGYGSLDK